MFDRLTEFFIKLFKIQENTQVKYLSGVGKSSNYDGGEIGSTDSKQETWSYPDVSWVNANKTIIANDNVASVDYALAAQSNGVRRYLATETFI